MAILAKSQITITDLWDGIDGAPGTSSYFHVKYSPVENPTDAQIHDEVDTYIGTYVDNEITDSPSASKYKWIKIEGIDGEQGVPGKDGVSGQTSYLHVKYSDNVVYINNVPSGDFTANNGETPGAFIGQYVDFIEDDSKMFADYRWYRIKGEQGPIGPEGVGYTINITGGTRGIAYAADGTGPSPATSTEFTAQLLKNGKAQTTISSCSWSVGGVFTSGTVGTTPLNYTPRISTTVDTKKIPSTFVTVSIKPSANEEAVVQTVPIVVTANADGLDWLADWNTGKTTIQDKSIASPRIFAGINTGVENAPKLSGVALGKDVLAGSETQIGLVGYQENRPTFKLGTDGTFLVSREGSSGGVVNGGSAGIYFDGTNLSITGNVAIKGGSIGGSGITDIVNGANAGTEAKNELDSLQIGSRNLILKSMLNIQNGSYLTTAARASVELVGGKKYTAVLKGQTSGGQKIGIWMNAGNHNVAYFPVNQNGVSYTTFTAVTPTSDDNKTLLSYYNFPNSGSSANPAKIEWIALYEGEVKPSLDWTPAPEDVDATIGSKVDDKQDAIFNRLFTNGTQGFVLEGGKVYINGEVIKANAISGNAIKAGTITANKLSVTDLTALGATIGGFSIKDGAIYSSKVGMGREGKEWAFWAGGDTSGLAPFRVGHGGEVVASNMNITGGNITLSNGSMLLGNTSGSSYMHWTGSHLWVKAAGMSIGTEDVATKSFVTTTANDITFKFSQSGGANLLRNSRGERGDTGYWTTGYYNGSGGSPAGWNFSRRQDTWTMNRLALQLQCANTNGGELRFEQQFDTVVGKTYTLSGLIAGHRSNKNVYARRTDGSWGWLASVGYGEIHGGEDINSWQKLSLTFTAQDTRTDIVFGMSTTSDDGYIWLLDAMISEGSVAIPWSPHAEELVNGSTVIDGSGLTVNNGAIRIKDVNGNVALEGDKGGGLLANSIAVTTGFGFTTTNSRQPFIQAQGSGSAIKTVFRNSGYSFFGAEYGTETFDVEMNARIGGNLVVSRTVTGTPNWDNNTLELRAYDGGTSAIAFHRYGHTTAMLWHDGNNDLRTNVRILAPHFNCNTAQFSSIDDSGGSWGAFSLYGQKNGWTGTHWAEFNRYMLINSDTFGIHDTGWLWSVDRATFTASGRHKGWVGGFDFTRGTGSARGRIACADESGNVRIEGWNSAGTYVTNYALTNAYFYPASSNGQVQLGYTGNRWSEVWCTRGAFNGSDSKLKENIQALGTKERAVSYSENHVTQEDLYNYVKGNGIYTFNYRNTSENLLGILADDIPENIFNKIGVWSKTEEQYQQELKEQEEHKKLFEMAEEIKANFEQKQRLLHGDDVDLLGTGGFHTETIIKGTKYTYRELKDLANKEIEEPVMLINAPAQTALLQGVLSQSLNKIEVLEQENQLLKSELQLIKEKLGLV